MSRKSDVLVDESDLFLTDFAIQDDVCRRWTIDRTKLQVLYMHIERPKKKKVKQKKIAKFTFLRTIKFKLH